MKKFISLLFTFFLALTLACDDSSSSDDDNNSPSTGSLKVTLSWPSGTVNSPSVEATLTPDGGSAEAVTFTLAGDSLSASYSGTGLEPGDYTLSIELRDYSTAAWSVTDHAVTIEVNDTETVDFILAEGDIASFSVTVSTFDDLSLDPESYWNGDGGDVTEYFISGGASFQNDNAGYSWSGFSYSNTTDTTTEGYTNQFSVYTGGGIDGSANYGVSYIMLDWEGGTYDPIPNIIYLADASGNEVQGLYVTNTTYAALSMLNGDSFAKKFGGTGGDDPDWFLLTIKGIDSEANYTGTVEFYLADYRFADNSQDYIVDEWTWVDLNSLGTVVGLEVCVSSSDTGDWGMNTPSYFAMDNLVLVDN